MIEKDNIQELFSKAFENQTSAVRPELWAGVQAKMAAAGVASTAAVATKGLSALTKWIIGSAAVGTVGVVTTVIALNSGEKPAVKENKNTKQETTTQIPVSQEEATNQRTLQAENYSSAGERIEHTSATTATPPSANPVISQDGSLVKQDQKAEELVVANPKNDVKSSEGKTPIGESKTEEKAKPLSSSKTPSERKNEEKAPVKTHSEDTKEPVNVELEAKVTHFPNVFTPNGDGSNDTYSVQTENISNFKLTVIDQDNHVVFETIDPNASWDGTFAGDRAKEGMYAAIVTGKQQNGKNFRDIQLFELRR